MKIALDLDSVRCLAAPKTAANIRVPLRIMAGMITFTWLLTLHGAGATTLQIRAGASSTNILLRGSDSVQHVLVTSRGADDVDRDLTRDVRWSVSPANLATVDHFGRVTPGSDGFGILTATSTEGGSANLPLRVEGMGTELPVHFGNQIVPIFTKYGCNGGGCHGKAAGQNGFRLSLLGFEPAEDYEHLVREARGRRLFPAAPERSLLLLKATAELPHGGGQRLTAGSEDYRMLVRWIEQGMPIGKEDAPVVTRIEVFPTDRTLALNSTQQLVVTACYSDGSTLDVTQSALYEANDPDLARCDENGLLSIFNQPGEVGVMVRYQGRVTTFRGTLPLGETVTHLPPSRGFVDDLIFAQLKKVGIPPSDLCDDATFIRRVTLDIAGRLPTSDEVEAFFAASAESLPTAREDRTGAERQTTQLGREVNGKARDAVIERLLGSADYADYFANKWGALLRNRRTDARQAHGTYAFHDWIRDSLLANKPYDQFVREIVAATGELSENPPVAWFRQAKTMQGQLEDVSQLFLGQRMQCAQCHHHPYEKWSQTDYWSFGAFFSRVGYKPGAQPGEDIVVHRRGTAEATNKKTGQSVRPAGLGDAIEGLTADDDPRQALADWMTRPDNRFFSRALVNRYWKHFFGRGLVDPEDDMRETNPPTHPALLEALANHFAKSGYDMKDLVRTLTRSTTYQLSAVPNQSNLRDKHHFARFQPRRLPAEVLYDAVNALLQSESKFDGLPPGTRAVCLPDNSFNASSYFLTVFGRPDSSSACECERSMEASLSQSLHLLNAKDIQERLSADNGRAARLAGESSRSDDVKLRELYLVAFAREPGAAELKTGQDHLKNRVEGSSGSVDPAKARREAWEDTVWALMNTKEFLFNH